MYAVQNRLICENQTRLLTYSQYGVISIILLIYETKVNIQIFILCNKISVIQGFYVTILLLHG